MNAQPEPRTAQERLERDRAQIESLLAGQRAFPRSRTMRLLLDGRGKLGLTVIATVLLALRPAAGARLLRLMPVANSLLRRLR